MLMLTFDDYFEYLSIQQKSAVLADKWLLEKVGSKASSFKETAKVLSQFKTGLGLVFDGDDKLETDVGTITYVDPGQDVYWEVSRRCQKSLSDGIKFGVLACYKLDGKNMELSKIDFMVADSIVKHFMSFFT